MLKFAGTVGLALAVANLKRRVRNLAVKGGLATIGAVIAVISLCFFLVAAHLALSAALHPIASAAIIAGVLLVIALLLFYLASRPMREQASAVEQPAAHAASAFSEGMTRLGGAFGSGPSPLANPVFQAAALALVAGVFLGRRRRPQDKD